MINPVEGGAEALYNYAEERCAGAAPKIPRLLAKAIDIRKAMTVAPPPMDEILRGLTPGMVGVILGTGGIGKSMLVLYVAYAVACVATGLDPLGCLLPPGVHKRGRVVYLAGEDGEDALWRRLFAFAKSFDSKRLDEIVERMHADVKIAPLVGEAPVLLDRNGFIVQEALDEIREVAQGSRTVVIDPLRQFHAGDENDNGHMTTLTKALAKIAIDESCAIILVHHMSKSAVRQGEDTATASSGAVAITDNARWSMTLRALGIKEFERLKLAGERWQYLAAWNPKVNHIGNGAPTLLKRVGGGLLAPVKRADYATGGSDASAGLAQIPETEGRSDADEIADDESGWRIG